MYKKHLSMILRCLFAFIFVTQLAYAGPPGPGPGPRPGPPGPAAPGPGGPPVAGPLAQAASTAAGKICLSKCSNSVKQCVDSCPEPELNIENPSIEGPQCMVDCMTTFVGCYEGC